MHYSSHGCFYLTHSVQALEQGSQPVKFGHVSVKHLLTYIIFVKFCLGAVNNKKGT